MAATTRTRTRPRTTTTGPSLPPPTPAPPAPPGPLGTDDVALELVLDINIARPDGRAEHLVIRHARVLVGSGAHCDIRIDGPAASREHLELELQGDKLLGRALCHAPPPLVQGVPLVAGALESGTQITVSGTRITVRLVREKGREVRSPLRRILASFAIALVACVLPVVVYAALRPVDDSVLGPPPQPVALWAGGPVTSCRFDAPDQALHLAKQMRTTGEAGRERYPFAIQDGVAAVTAFETAAACHRVGAQKRGQGDLDLQEVGKDIDAANALRTIVERDYHAHRVRLQHAVETDDLKSALLEVRTLRSMTGGLKGPYVEWLGMVERRLDLSLKAATEKK
jgi:hypothetical protein